MTPVRIRLVLALTAMSVLFPIVVAAQNASSSTNGQIPLLLRNPSLSQEKIAFLYADDVWTVSRSGGEAERLTSNGKVAAGPYFSPDGAEIAYSAHLNGNVDVYVMPSGGGVPRRITWHPGGSEVVGWTPDGKNVLITNGATSFRDFARLFDVHADGSGMPESLPLPSGVRGLLLTRRPVDRLSAHYEVAGRVEAVSWRPDDAHLDRQPQDPRPCESAARKLQRLQSGLGRQMRYISSPTAVVPFRSSATTPLQNR